MEGIIKVELTYLSLKKIIIRLQQDWLLKKIRFYNRKNLRRQRRLFRRFLFLRLGSYLPSLFKTAFPTLS